jgi:catechol 1,2-dioxygenase
MTKDIANTDEIERFLDRVAGTNNPGGNTRTKQLVRRIVSDLYRAIEDLDVTQDEYWAAVSYLTAAGQARELALLSPGLGFDHFLDLVADKRDRAANLGGGTPRTIEGPLYVEGAPRSNFEARLDDGTEQGETLLMHGRVVGSDKNPIAGAIVEVWHADSKGNYSFFDPTQSSFNLRRSIVADGEGRYRFRTIMPSGYGCPPGGMTQRLLDRLGRHGQRPAHIHFFVAAAGFRHLTTQINIAGDPLVHDDFAFATRDGLIPNLVRHATAAPGTPLGIEGSYAEIEFDFVMEAQVKDAPPTEVHRDRAKVA